MKTGPKARLARAAEQLFDTLTDVERSAQIGRRSRHDLVGFGIHDTGKARKGGNDNGKETVLGHG